GRQLHVAVISGTHIALIRTPVDGHHAPVRKPVHAPEAPARVDGVAERHQPESGMDARAAGAGHSVGAASGRGSTQSRVAEGRGPATPVEPAQNRRAQNQDGEGKTRFDSRHDSLPDGVKWSIPIARPNTSFWHGEARPNHWYARKNPPAAY